MDEREMRDNGEHRDAHLDEGTVHAWLDDALSADESARVAAHAAACAVCAALVAEARGFLAAASRIVGALDDVPADVVPVPAARLAAVPIAAPTRPERSSASRRFSRGRQGLAAAAMLLMAGGSFVLARAGRGVIPPQELGAPAASPAEDLSQPINPGPAFDPMPREAQVAAADRAAADRAAPADRSKREAATEASAAAAAPAASSVAAAAPTQAPRTPPLALVAPTPIADAAMMASSAPPSLPAAQQRSARTMGAGTSAAVGATAGARSFAPDPAVPDTAAAARFLGCWTLDSPMPGMPTRIALLAIRDLAAPGSFVAEQMSGTVAAVSPTARVWWSPVSQNLVRLTAVGTKDTVRTLVRMEADPVRERAAASASTSTMVTTAKRTGCGRDGGG